MLPKEYARPALNAVMLGALIDLISDVAPGEAQERARDVLGRVYEYVLGPVRGHGYVLTRGRYVRAAAVEDDETPFVEQFAALQETLDSQFAEDQRLEQAIRENLGRVGRAASEV